LYPSRRKSELINKKDFDYVTNLVGWFLLCVTKTTLLLLNALFLVSILYSFHLENDSIINSFHTIAPSSPKPSQCTPTTHWEHYKEHGMKHQSTMVWEIWMETNKTNHLAS
jgi:hypothetical protein